MSLFQTEERHFILWLRIEAVLIAPKGCAEAVCPKRSMKLAKGLILNESAVRNIIAEGFISEAVINEIFCTASSIRVAVSEG